MVSNALATSLESLIMPGKVIEGHKKYEQECSECHANFSKKKQDTLCLNCHKKIRSDKNKERGFHGTSPIASRQKCKQCHTEHKGRDANIVPFDSQTFNHKHTDFKLYGKHRGLACKSCHKEGKKYRQAPSSCYSCHKEVDAHDGELGKKCYTCHHESSWKKIRFNHDKTDFPLKAKHKKVLCLSCHPDNRHKDTPKTCYACHSLDDAHNKRYGKKCQSCHSEKDWDKAQFDHNRKTKFALKGSHKTVKCDSCHTGTTNIYKKKPKKSCYACHKTDDLHKGKNGTKCQKCHSPNSWRKTKFSHNKDTEFPLRAKHAKLACVSCHMGSLHKDKLKKECNSCHKVDDVHKGQQGRQCQQCHSEKGWKVRVKFNHDITDFPLIGHHAILQCSDCHDSHQYKDTSKKCYACHENDDKHKKTLGVNCQQCHNPNSWAMWLFDHNQQTDFLLTGAHKNLECIACHTESGDETVRRLGACASCHYKDDKHRGDFGKGCDQCHNTTRFSDIEL